MKRLTREELRSRIREIYERNVALYNVEIKKDGSLEYIKKTLDKYLNILYIELMFYGIKMSDIDIMEFLLVNELSRFDDLIDVIERNTFNIEDNKCFIDKDLINVDHKIAIFLTLYNIVPFQKIIQGKFWSLENKKSEYDNFIIKTFKTKKYLEIIVK